MITLKGSSGIYEGPTIEEMYTDGIEVNTKFHELNTDKYYYYDGSDWVEIPGGGGGGGGFVPTEDQLAAMNSGITSTDVQQIETNKTNISLIYHASGTKLYFTETEPTTSSIGDYWLSSANGVKVYGRTDNYFDEQYTGISTIPTNIIYQPINVGNGDFTLSTTTPNVEGIGALLFLLSGNVDTGASTVSNGVTSGTPRTVSSVDGYVTVAYRGSSTVSPVDYQTMLNSGTSAETYVPYLAWQ